MANGDGGSYPTTNKELWVILRALPYQLQIFVAIVLAASLINIPDGIFSLLNDSSSQELFAITDTLDLRLSELEVALEDHTKRNELLVTRVDSITSIILQNRESLDFLWCLNERAESPEVRVYCGELRDAVRQALELRAGVGR